VEGHKFFYEPNSIGIMMLLLRRTLVLSEFFQQTEAFIK
jgi:hypothetical protein